MATLPSDASNRVPARPMWARPVVYRGALLAAALGFTLVLAWVVRRPAFTGAAPRAFADDAPTGLTLRAPFACVFDRPGVRRPDVERRDPPWDGEWWRARAFVPSLPARLEIASAWSGWTLSAWEVTPPRREPFTLHLFDARRPKVMLIEVRVDDAPASLRLGGAYRLGSVRKDGTSLRCAEFQLLRFDGSAVRVLASKAWSGDWLPPPDEQEEAGWVWRAGTEFDVRCMHPVLSGWSWNGDLAPEFAANELWPSRGRTHFTAVFSDRESVARERPLALWPYPTLLLSIAPPELTDLPLDRR